MILQAFPVLATALVFQAGGGGSFGGGGGGGGGDDGVGGLLVFIFRVLLPFAIEHPLIGVPLILVSLVAVAALSGKAKNRHQERTIRRQRPKIEGQAARVSADELKASDPEFDLDRFLARVRLAFQKAQDAWCAQGLEPIRPFVSDGVFERFSLQIERQREEGWRQGMDDVRVLDLSLGHVEASRHYDTVSVRIPFHARIYRRDIETGKKISDTDLPRNHFTELWSFVRRRGTKTISSEGLIEGKCPNCRTPLTMNQSARCTYCESRVRSGAFDWVLTEITQASEWQPENELLIPGVAAYMDRDPGFNLPLLEDHASVAFWRKIAADHAGDATPLLRVARPEFNQRYRAELEEKQLRIPHDAAVGSVRTLGVLPGPQDDRAVIEVVWDSALPDGPQPSRKPAKRRLLSKTLFVFARRTGQTTELSDSLTTMHCSNCGARDAGGTSAICDYCEAPRTGDASTWLLVDVLPCSSTTRPPILAELTSARLTGGFQGDAPRPSQAGLLAWAVGLARADGEVDADERRALESIAAGNDIPNERIDSILADDQGLEPHPADEKQARLWLASLTELALTSGSIKRDEHRFLMHVTRRLGLKRSDLEETVRTLRKGLYRRAREAKRFDRKRRQAARD